MAYKSQYYVNDHKQKKYQSNPAKLYEHLWADLKDFIIA